MRFDYIATPWPPDAPDPQPQLRAELEDVGFRVLGGCSLAPGSLRAVDTIARQYGERADEFVQWAAVPGQVLASPDGTTFAHLAWLWDCRYATLTTVLADGSLVQTTADWEGQPPRPTALPDHVGTLDPSTEQLSMTSDPHTEIVPGTGHDLWAAHRARLDRLSPTDVPTHSDLGDFVAVYAAESRARSRWSGRLQVVGFLLAFGTVLLPFLAVSWFLGPRPWWVDASTVVAAGLVTLSLFRRYWLRARRSPGLRSDVRVPVPGTTGDV